jgi:hypothetical protein
MCIQVMVAFKLSCHMIRPRTRGGGRESATIRGAQSYPVISEKTFDFGSGWGSFLFSFICLFPVLGLWGYGPFPIPVPLSVVGLGIWVYPAAFFRSRGYSHWLLPYSAANVKTEQRDAKQISPL